MRSYALITLSALLVQQAAAHAVVTQVQGENGVTTTGFGVIDGVSRDGLDEQDFQIDTSVFKDLVSNPCGETIGGGSVDIATNLAAVEEQGSGQLPSLTSDLVINMNIHQVNADGGGPFFAMFNVDGTGKTWEDATITVQAPGARGLIDGGALDSPLAVQLPEGTVCTGGTNGDACLIRVSNGGTDSVANGPGPFGSCLAVQNPDANAAASTSTSTSNSTTTATDTTTTATDNNNNGGRRNRHNRNGNKHRRTRSRRSVPNPTRRSLIERKLQNREIVRKKIQEVANSLAKRALSLSSVDVSTLKTVIGAAIDTPIDLAAGIDSTDPNGGRANVDTTKALISIQEAENIKEAVRQALTDAIDTIATDPGVKVDNPTTSDEDIQAAQDRAIAALADGSLKSVSVAPSGITGGDIRGEQGQNALGVQTATDLKAAATGSSDSAAATITSAASAATVTASSTAATQSATSGSSNAATGNDGFVRLDNKKVKKVKRSPMKVSWK